MNHILVQSDRIILVYFLALNSFYALLLVLAIPEIWEQTRLAEDDDFQRLMQSDALPPVTLLVPAYNESATIEHSVTAMLTLWRAGIWAGSVTCSALRTGWPSGVSREAASKRTWPRKTRAAWTVRKASLPSCAESQPSSSSSASGMRSIAAVRMT